MDNKELDEMWDKIKLNSFYPMTSNNNYIFYEESDAQLITKEGKKILKELKIKEFIFKRLDDMHSKIEGINIRYEQSLNGEHIIEISPFEIYQSDKKYILWEIEFEEEFIKKYPEEESLFISKHSLTEIKNCEREWKHKI